MTSHPDLFAALSAPFDPPEVKARARAGRQLRYVTARTVMNRLDDVLGPECWWDRYRPNGTDGNSVICALTILLPDGRALTKEDAGGCAGMADEGDDDKSALSDAFKRAAVKFGVARYLYRDGVPSFARAGAGAGEAGKQASPASSDAGDGRKQASPAPAAPDGRHRKERHEWQSARTPGAAGNGGERPRAAGNGNADADAPRSGKAFYAWCKGRERESEGLIRYLMEWSRLQGYPRRWIEWSPGQVAAGYAEATRRLSSIESQEPEYQEAMP